jgi:molecular chaperone HscC
VRGVLVTDLFTPLLDRGTVIPASRLGTFSTLTDGQTEVRLEVYQGEHALVRDNRKLGELVISGLRPARAGEESLSVRYTYDLNGLLEVEATVESTGEVRHLLLEESPGSLTPDQVAHAREAMKQWKVHPRDTLPNLAAMERGEALYTQLVGPARVELGAYLAGFRAALESQDPRQIEEGREILLAVISRLR